MPIQDKVLEIFKHLDSGHALGDIRVRDGYAYASDTFMICARKAKADEADHGNGEPPKVSGILARVEEAIKDCVHPMPELGLTDCGKCNGKGETGENIPCISCHGTGECDDCACGAIHECGRCKGSGFSKVKCDCDECGGEGLKGGQITDGYISVIGTEIRVRAGKALNSIPGVKIGVIKYFDESLGDVVFCHEEYRGIVLGKRMPARP